MAKASGSHTKKLSMDKAAREAFLARTRVAVMSVADTGRGPLLVPIWYAYEPGGRVLIVTPKSSKKARLIRAAGRVSLLVQTDVPPYQYVSVEGPATVDDSADSAALVASMAHRYMGRSMGDAYLKSTAKARPNNALVTLTPERWASADFGKTLEHQAAALPGPLRSRLPGLVRAWRRLVGP